jgi:hypothetical protein
MPDPPLTPAHHLYLEAFDRFLKARGTAERMAARTSMSVRLNFVLAEASLDLPNDTRWSDSVCFERDPGRCGSGRWPRAT